LLAFVLAGDDFDFIVALDLDACHLVPFLGDRGGAGIRGGDALYVLRCPF
jgi:hypothetical protein